MSDIAGRIYSDMQRAVCALHDVDLIEAYRAAQMAAKSDPRSLLEVDLMRAELDARGIAHE